MVKNMTQGSPIKLIAAFTVPLLIGNIFQQFYNIADIIIVGRFIGIRALAAVGATAPLFMGLLALTIGLVSGFTVITAQRFGAGDFDGVRRSVAMSAILSGSITLALMLISGLLMPKILYLMNISDELYDDAYHYVIIVSYGLIATMMYNLLSCICRALGDSRTPLYFLILSTLMNIGLAVLFIVSFGWGVPGSAIALVIAQGVAAILCLFYMRHKFPFLRLRREDWRFDKDAAARHLKVGMPMAMQFSIITLGIIVVQAVCNTFGPETIAAFISATRIEQVAMQPMISFGIAMAVYTAQNYGARKFDRIKKGVRQCSYLSFGLCLGAVVLMYFFGTALVSGFTSEEAPFLLEQARLYLMFTVPFYFFLGQIFVYRNALQGMGISIVPLLSSLLELVIRSGAALVLASVWAYRGLCAASPLCWVVACVFTTACYYYFSRRLLAER